MLSKRGFVSISNSATTDATAAATSTTSASTTLHQQPQQPQLQPQQQHLQPTVQSSSKRSGVARQSQSQRATQVVESQDFEDTTETDPWARLVSLHVDCKHVDLFLPVIRIGRKRDGQVVHNDIRISGSHCVIYRHAALVGDAALLSSTAATTTNNHVVDANNNSNNVDGAASRVDAALHAVAYVLDLSTNGTYVNGARCSPSTGSKVEPPSSGVDGVPTLEALRAIDAVRPLQHGDKIALVKSVDAGDLQFTYLFEDLARGVAQQELRQAELQSRYEVGNIIGTGAFSQVRVCVDRRTGEQRCVKIVDKRKYGTAPSAAQRGGRGGGGGNARVPTPVQLGREIDILKRVRHPNIVNVCDVFDAPRYIYLVLELARGGELFDRLYESGALEESRARDIFTQLLHAIEYLHRQNIVHRDLKPENILFVDDHSDAVKITDFGLARLVGNAELMQTLCGTPAYVAPEIIRAVQMRQQAAAAGEAPPPPPTAAAAAAAAAAASMDQGYSKAVDMWSLGIILYALLSGAPPFDEEPGGDEPAPDGEPALSLFEQIARGSYGMPDYLFGGVSEDAKDLVRSLLVVEPTVRLTVAQALAHRWIVGDAGVSQTTSTQQQQQQPPQASIDTASLNNEGFASPRPKRKRQRLGASQPPSSAAAVAAQSSLMLAPETPAAKRQLAGSSDGVSSSTAAGGGVVVVPDTPPSRYTASGGGGGGGGGGAMASIVQTRRVASANVIVIGDSPIDAGTRRNWSSGASGVDGDGGGGVGATRGEAARGDAVRSTWRGEARAGGDGSPSVPVPQFSATNGEAGGDGGEAGGAGGDVRERSGEVAQKLQF